MDEIKKDAEVTEEVKAEEVKAEEVKTEEVKAEEVKAEEPKAQEVRYTQVEKKQSNVLSITALVLGIVAIVFDFIFVWVGLAAGVVGIIIGVKARKQENAKGLATAGFVLSIIGVALGGVMLVCTLCLLGTAISAGGLSEYM